MRGEGGRGGGEEEARRRRGGVAGRWKGVALYFGGVGGATGRAGGGRKRVEV